MPRACSFDLGTAARVLGSVSSLGASHLWLRKHALGGEAHDELEGIAAPWERPGHLLGAEVVSLCVRAVLPPRFEKSHSQSKISECD